MDRPVFGRASAASGAPWELRPSASAGTAAVRADGGATGPWTLRAVTLAGVRHRLAGTGPEDDYAWAVVDGSLVVAVGDGVGSVAGSAAASHAAVVAAVADPADPVGAADRAVRQAGGATTLVVATVDDGGGVELVRVGDSAAMVLSDGGWREVWEREPDDGTVSPATAALPANDPRIERAAIALDPGDVLVLVTDGVADPLRDGPSTVAPGLAAVLEVPPEPIELARVVDFSRRGVGDDRTLLAVWVGAVDLV